MHRHRRIIIEGMDGCGKLVVARRFAEQLLARYLREPATTTPGEEGNMQVVLLCANGRTLLCPVRTTGKALLALFEQPSLALVSAQVLRDGSVYQRAMYVGPNDKVHNLSNYTAIHSRDRELVASIQTADVMINTSSNAVGALRQSAGLCTRLNPAEPVVVPQELLCQCHACARMYRQIER